MGKEKKEIGKLIELLNEYDNGWDYDDYYGPYQYGQDRDAYHLCKYQLVSKEYGFIKWLVENDKIDLVKVYENLTNYEIEIRIRAVKELLENNEEDTIAYLKLLMLLAIQDEPIRFLCEIIK